MQVLKLTQSNNCDIPYNLGDELGYGADGQIFELVDYPDRVIKLSVLYDCKVCENPSYEEIEKVLTYLEQSKPDTCARVYEHKFMFNGARSTVEGDRNYVVYYYVMEKLYKTTEDERKVFHSILSHEDRGVKKDYSNKVVSDMLFGMQRGLDFDFDKVLYFYKNVKKSRMNHNDLHVRNIMKDSAGNYKLIDFDRASIGE
jgi:thiamine kinase-like enzyme